jgi:hypothetical protein
VGHLPYISDQPLLPFTEHGKRYDNAQWAKLVQISGMAL